MKKITLSEFWNQTKKQAIHCKTEYEANKLLFAFNKLGKKWYSGYDYLTVNCWKSYKENTCYDNFNLFCSIDWYKSIGCKVYEFDEVDLDN